MVLGHSFVRRMHHKAYEDCVEMVNICTLRLQWTITHAWIYETVIRSQRSILWSTIRPGVIVIYNSNDYNCSSNSNRWNITQCNSNRKQSNSNRAITLL